MGQFTALGERVAFAPMKDSFDDQPPASPLTPPAERASLRDGLRFAFGTLTVLPARITRWDRPAARTGMACAPLAGLVVGLLAAVPGVLLLILGGGPLLAAAVTVAVPAALTRGCTSTVSPTPPTGWAAPSRPRRRCAS